jgi:tRNA(fMet)-specific endonuclease VapC
MYLLDTDHLTLIDRGGTEGSNIRARLSAVAATDVAVSIVSYEEQMRGWMAEIAQLRGVDRQMIVYGRLERLLQYYCAAPLLPFDASALNYFQNLWLLRLRVGTMDLKIASIALANDATLLTRNVSDFGKIPGLKVEDWSV